MNRVARIIFAYQKFYTMISKFSIFLILALPSGLFAQSHDSTAVNISIDYTIDKKGSDYVFVKTIARDSGEVQIEKSKPLTKAELINYIAALKKNIEETQKAIDTQIPQYSDQIQKASLQLLELQTLKKLNEEALKKLDSL